MTRENHKFFYGLTRTIHPPRRWEVIDCQTDERVGAVRKSRKSAQAAADRRDDEYGAVRYFVRPVEGRQS